MHATASMTDYTPQGLVPLDDRQAEADRLLEDVIARMQRSPVRPARRSWLSRMATRRPVTLPPVKGIYLWGGVGRGKTHLMDAFFDRAPFTHKRRVHFHHFMQEVHDQLALLPPQPDPLEVIAGRLAERSRLLCLDEFVVTDITDAMILHGLLRAFFARGITLVTTSNLPPDDLYRDGLQRDRFLAAIRLLHEHTDVFNLDGGTDYRLRALQQADTYFSPLGDAAEAGLERHLANRSGGHDVAAGSLAVNHREIPVRRLAPGVAWFDFAAVCDGPRATADYIEIAREYHTVLVSGVPQLTPAHDAAARRFLHLVDEFYDRNVKLIVSAAVRAEALYLGSTLAFEYERLHSRLTEMRSAAYLARPHLPL